MTLIRPSDPFAHSVLLAAKIDAEEKYPHYSVGVVRDGIYFPCKNNTIATLEEAVVDADELILHQSEGMVEAIIYSHPKGSKCPSESERSDSLAHTVIWGITPIVEGVAQSIIWWGATEIEPLLGRPTILGVWDCYELWRNWWSMKGFHYERVLYDESKFVEDGGIFSHYSTELGLENKGKLQIDKLVEGDMVLLAIGSTQPNHCGVYTGGGKFIHYPTRKESKESNLIDWWRHYKTILRHST